MRKGNEGKQKSRKGALEVLTSLGSREGKHNQWKNICVPRTSADGHSHSQALDLPSAHSCQEHQHKRL